MSMPHPRVLMIPFACVIKMRTTRAGACVDIYSSAQIGPLLTASPGLSEIAGVLDAWDDLPPGKYVTGGLPGVIAKSTANVFLPWKARKLDSTSSSAKPENVSAGEYKTSMLPDYYYYLVPQRWRASKKHTGKKNTKKK
jgi:hypothetical protein